MKTLSDKIVKANELILTDKTVNNSYILGLVFYKTKIENVFLTNYNLSALSDHEIDLSERKIWIAVLINKEKQNWAFCTEELIKNGGLYEFINQTILK